MLHVRNAASPLPPPSTVLSSLSLLVLSEGFCIALCLPGYFPCFPIFARCRFSAWALCNRGGVQPLPFRQDAFEISATVMPYLLMSHNVQACEPLVSLKVPAAHSVQTPQSMPKYPGSHLQFCSATLAYKDTEFAGHAEQFDGPTVSL